MAEGDVGEQKGDRMGAGVSDGWEMKDIVLYLHHSREVEHKESLPTSHQEKDPFLHIHFKLILGLRPFLTPKNAGADNITLKLQRPEGQQKSCKYLFFLS